MTKIIAVALQKGGVGKTTTVQHLGHALAERGHNVLMIDGDPQGSLSKRYDLTGAQFDMSHVLGVGDTGEELQDLRKVVIQTQQDRLFLAPCDSRLSRTNKHLDGELDGVYHLDMLIRNQRLPFGYVIIDTPPGDSMLLMAALVAADELIVPVQLTPMGFEGFADIDKTVQAARKLQRVRPPMRLEYRAIVPTFFARGEQVSDGLLDVLHEHEHPDYEGLPLPLSPPVPRSTIFGKASAPRPVATNGDVVERALTIWEASQEDIAIRAGQAYMALAEMVDTYV